MISIGIQENKCVGINDKTINDYFMRVIDHKDGLQFRINPYDQEINDKENYQWLCDWCYHLSIEDI